MTRLETIAAMAASAAACGAPSSLVGAAGRSAWELAVADHCAARRALDADTEETHWDELSAAYADAAADMLKTPAPDGPALLYKLEYLFGPEARSRDGGGPAYCAEWTDAWLADAHRLLWNGRA